MPSIMGVHAVSQRWRVIIVGGGFGGLRAAQAMKSAPVEVTLIDRRNDHLFQPLLYQVATGSLSPGQIAAPLRSVLSRQHNTRVLLGEVVDLDPLAKRVRLADGASFARESSRHRSHGCIKRRSNQARSEQLYGTVAATYGMATHPDTSGEIR